VVLREGADAEPEALLGFVAERVAGYKHIRSVALVPAIPRTPSGKILRRVLRDQMKPANVL
jgi:acyl-coenzyme A synthetase/AMP-(fatty) acid ligase